MYVTVNFKWLICHLAFNISSDWITIYLSCNAWHAVSTTVVRSLIITDGQETSGCLCILKCNSTLTKCSCSSIGKIASIRLQIQINNSQPKKRDTSLVPIHHHQLKASSVTKGVRLNTKVYCPFTDISSCAEMELTLQPCQVFPFSLGSAQLWLRPTSGWERPSLSPAHTPATSTPSCTERDTGCLHNTQPTYSSHGRTTEKTRLHTIHTSNTWKRFRILCLWPTCNGTYIHQCW